MIVYNVTIKIDVSHHEDWVQWMNKTHIPDVLTTGYFTGYRLARVISLDESDGITYSIQYSCQEMKLLHQYQVLEAPRLQAEHNERYDGKFVAFRSIIEVLAES